MTIWRITGGEGASGAGERAAPRFDVVEHDTPLLHVAAALHAAQARMPADVHVDLAALAFMDVAGLRAFTLAARDMHEHGRLLVLHTVSPHIDRLFRLIGWHTSPGLEIHCRPRV
jgi:anti-anti-sigma factor